VVCSVGPSYFFREAAVAFFSTWNPPFSPDYSSSSSLGSRPYLRRAKVRRAAIFAFIERLVAPPFKLSGTSPSCSCSRPYLPTRASLGRTSFDRFLPFVRFFPFLPRREFPNDGAALGQPIVSRFFIEGFCFSSVGKVLSFFRDPAFPFLRCNSPPASRCCTIPLLVFRSLLFFLCAIFFLLSLKQVIFFSFFFPEGVGLPPPMPERSPDVGCPRGRVMIIYRWLFFSPRLFFQLHRFPFPVFALFGFLLQGGAGFGQTPRN